MRRKSYKALSVVLSVIMSFSCPAGVMAGETVSDDSAAGETAIISEAVTDETAAGENTAAETTGDTTDETTSEAASTETTDETNSETTVETDETADESSETEAAESETAETETTETESTETESSESENTADVSEDDESTETSLSADSALEAETDETATVSEEAASKSSGSSGSVTWTGENTITSSGTYSNQTYSTTTDSYNALLVDGNDSAINVTLENPTATKGGTGDAGDDSNFYGINAAILAKGQANLTITGANITTTAKGGNGVFSYGGNGGKNGASGDGTIVNISDSTITTSGSGAGGIMTTGGGETVANNLTVTTTGASSAPIRTDRGGGTVTVTKGSYTSSGLGSPAIYSTADVTVNDATLVSKLSEGVCIEGKNSITLNNCSLTASNTKKNGHANYYDTIMIYQSMSGDADSGTSEFTMNGGSLTSNSGYMFHVTNTAAVVNLTGVTLTNNDSSGDDADVLFDVSDDGWSGSDNTATLNASEQTMTGKIQSVGSDSSSLTVNLNDSSQFKGSVNYGISDRGTVAMTIASGSLWQLTGDSYVSSISGKGSVTYGDYTLYVNNTAYTASNPYSGVGSGNESVDDDTEDTSVSSNTVSYAGSGLDPIVTVSSNSAVMVKGQSWKFGSGKWTTSDSTVLGINSSTGLARAKKAGSAVITNTKVTPSVSYTIKVEAPSISAAKLSMMTGDTQTLTIDGNSENLPTTWITSNPAVASVSEGSVTALGKGTAYVRCYINGKAYSCKVTVKHLNAVPVISDSESSITVNSFRTVSIKSSGSLKPAKAVWSVSGGNLSALKTNLKGVVTLWGNDNFTISNKGKITGLMPTGDSPVTITDTVSGKSLTVNVEALPTKSVIYLNKGASTTLAHYGVKKTAAYPVKWTVSGSSITIKNDSAAKATITGSSTGKSTLTCSYRGVTFTTDVYVESTEFNTSSGSKHSFSKTGTNKYLLRLKTGYNYTLDPVSVYKTLNYTSSKPAFAFAAEDGTIYARTAGKTSKVTTKINGKTVTIVVKTQ